jgi:hypothetical protein
MDDERIKALTVEVLQALHAPALERPASPGLEARVAALETVVRTVVLPLVHPSLSLLGPEAEGSGRCVMEPDKPCVQSGMCRTLGH